MKYNLIALACAVLLAAGLSLTVTAGPTEPDTDSDGIVDQHDNCTLVSNNNQADYDQDGYGQLCDSDFNNDGKIQLTDFITFKALYPVTGLPYAGEIDFNCDGKTQLTDFITFKALYGDGLQQVGPGGQACAGPKGGCVGNVPCP
jgi:hypothetical protein